MLQHIIPGLCGYTLPYTAISLAVAYCTEAGLATQDQRNPYTLERIVVT